MKAVPYSQLTFLKTSLALLLCSFSIVFVYAQNPTNGGIISEDQVIYEGSIPDKLISIEPASGGGTGTIEYIWIYTDDADCKYSLEANTGSAPDSNSEEYQPGPLTDSRCYGRCARRVGSGNPEFSVVTNQVKIQVIKLSSVFEGLQLEVVDLDLPNQSKDYLLGFLDKAETQFKLNKKENGKKLLLRFKKLIQVYAPIEKQIHLLEDTDILIKNYMSYPTDKKSKEQPRGFEENAKS